MSLAIPDHLEFSKVDFTRDWDAVFDSLWQSWGVPKQVPLMLMFANVGEGGEIEAAASELKRKQILEDALSSPDQIWMKLVDKNLEAVGLPCVVAGWCATYWNRHPGLVYKSMPENPHIGFDESSQRLAMCNILVTELKKWHTLLMGEREHIYAHCQWALPEYRGRGISDMSVQGVVDMADNFGTEAYCEVTFMARRVLERHGFITVAQVQLPVDIADPTEDTRQLMGEYQANPVALLWRPKNGIFKESEVPFPILAQLGKPRARL